MASLVLPDSRFEMPELFYPGRKPVGNVKIDRNRLLTNKLARFGLGTHELVNNKIQKYYSNAADIRGGYLSFNNPSINSEALLLSDLGSTWLDGSNGFTLFLDIRFHGSSSANADSLMGQWSRIQNSLDNNAKRTLFRYKSDTAELQLFANASAEVNLLSSKDLDDNLFHRISGVFRDGFLYIFADGLKLSGSTAVSGSILSTSHSKVPEVMGGHDVTDSITYTSSPRFDLKSWGIWDIGFSDIEIERLHYNPYQFLIPA